MTDKAKDTKERILRAAEAEFLAGGYAGARMQAIADRADINKAMLHYHFRSKDVLFAQIFKNKARLLLPEVEAKLRSHDDFVEFTCEFVDAYFALLMANPYLPFFLMQVAAYHQEMLDELAPDFPRLFIRAFRAAVRQEKIRALDPQQFMVSLFGLCAMPFVAENLLKKVLRLDDKKYAVLLAKRAEEIKRYVRLLLVLDTSALEKKNHG